MGTKSARTLLSFAVGLALVAGAMPLDALAAQAAAVGSAGLYVPSQGRILDTRYGIGGITSPFTADVTRALQITGTAPVPASAVTAVQMVITAIDPTVQGTLSGGPDTSSLSPLMVYDGGRGGITSNSAIVAVDSSGKMYLKTTSTTNVLIDVQGYYTAGNGVAAPGGYTPVNGSRIVDTRAGTGAPAAQVTTGQTVTVQATGVGGVPAGASAVYVNIMVRNYGAGAFLTPYAADKPRPNVALNFPATSTQAIPLGAQVALSSSGAFKLYLGGASTSIDLFIDVEGYFTPGKADGSFTPATGRILDTRVAPATAVAPNQTLTVGIAGQAGLPTVSSGLTAAVLNVTAIDAQTGGGFARLWPTGTVEPNPFHNINYSNSAQSNLVTVPVGADGAVNLHNVSGDTVNFVLDVEGFYSGTAVASPQIACDAPFGADSWSTAIPAAPITCTIAASKAAVLGEALQYRFDGSDTTTVPLSNASATTVSVQVAPTAGWHSIEAVRAGGIAATYGFGIGDWAAAPVAPTPDSGQRVPSLSPTLAVNSDGDQFGPDVEVQFTVSSEPDGITNPIVTSDWTDSSYTIPNGLLQNGSTYYWTAQVRGQSEGRPGTSTVQSPVWAFTVDLAAPDPNAQSDQVLIPLASSPTMDTVQMAASAQAAPTAYSGEVPSTPNSNGTIAPQSATNYSVKCSGELQFPHISTNIQRVYGKRVVDNKVTIKCTGYGATTVAVRARGLLSFAPASSATDTANKRFQERATSNETKTFTVNGRSQEFTVPNVGTNGGGIGKGFWATTFTWQLTVYGHAGTVGTATSTKFADLR